MQKIFNYNHDIEIRLEKALKVILKQSEKNYFKAGAVTHLHPFFVFYLNPDYSDYPLWSAAFLKEDTVLPSGYISEIESVFKMNNISLIRIYCQDDAGIVNNFKEAGYTVTLEKGYIWMPGYLKNSIDEVEKPEVELREVVSLEDWMDREQIFDEMDFPDGKYYTAPIWNHFEKLKADIGVMTAYMIMHDEVNIGTLSTILEGDFLRLKNLYIRKKFRQLGYATAVIQHFKLLILTRGLSGFGAFVIHNSLGMPAYSRIGMQWKVSQWECTRPTFQNEGSSPE